MTLKRLVLHISNVSNRQSLEILTYSVELTKDKKKFKIKHEILDNHFKFLTVAELNVPCVRIDGILDVFGWIWMDEHISEDEAKDVLLELADKEILKRIELHKKLAESVALKFSEVINSPILNKVY